MAENTNTPLDDTFEPIELKSYDDEVEDATIPPLPDAKWKFTIYGYEVIKCGEKAKVPGAPYVKFLTEVGDKDEEFNGRKIRTGPLMLSGPGFRFFLDFAEVVSPTRKFKSGTTLIDQTGKSKYLDSFKGCTFAATTTKDLNSETGKETGFNNMSAYFKLG